MTERPSTYQKQYLLPSTLLVTLALLVLPCPLFAEEKETLIFATTNWCPYVCVQNTDKISPRGYMVDIVENIFHSLNVKIDIRMMPYDRSIAMAMRGEIAGILGTAPGDAPGLIYPRQNLGISTDSFITLADSNWTYTEPRALENIRYGTVLGYRYKSLEEHVSKYQHTDKIQALDSKIDIQTTKRNLQKLQAGTIDAVLDNRAVLEFNIALYQLDESVRFAGHLEEKFNMWLAFSPQLKQLDDICLRFNRELSEMRSSGKLGYILRRYGIEDWGETFHILSDYEKNRLQCE